MQPVTTYTPPAEALLDNDAFLAALDDAISRRAMLKHPFYQRWSAGQLTVEDLQVYAGQYYHHVKMFPRYVSNVHANTDDKALRKELLANLNEEEAGADDHPELWLRFAEGLGCERTAVEATAATDLTCASVAKLTSITRHGETVEGLAALYAYESQIPEVAQTKREGLKQFYGIDSERAVAFFSVHEEADQIHRQVERDALARTANTPALREKALVAAAGSAEALWQFLDGMQALRPGSAEMAC